MMKAAICRLSAGVTVVGSKAALTIAPGMQVDLDQVVGEVAPGRDDRGDIVAPAKRVTLADALGPKFLSSFELVVSATPAPVDKPSRRLPAATE